MAKQTNAGDRRSNRPGMFLGERGDGASSPTDDRPRIESDGRYAGPSDDQPPDPRAVIEDLRKRLRIEQEKSLNATDAVLGARAVAAQARAETQETFYRLHVRETELGHLKELLAGHADGSVGAGGTGVDQGLLAGLGGVSNGARSVESASSAARSLLSAIKRAVTE